MRPLTARRLSEIRSDLDRLVMPEPDDIRAMAEELLKLRPHSRKLAAAHGRLGAEADRARALLRDAHELLESAPKAAAR